MIWALQNDHQNLSFVKYNDLLGDKMIRNGHKNGQPLACHFHFETLFNCYCIVNQEKLEKTNKYQVNNKH